MKRIAVFIISIIIIPFIFCITVTAEENIADELGIDINSAKSNIPDDVSEIIEEHNFSADNTDAISSITITDIINYLVDTVKDKLKAPAKLLTALLAVIILSSLINGIGESLKNKSLERVYEIIGVLICTGIITEPISDCISITAETIYSGSDFMIGYIPVYVGISASSGSITSAAAYNMIVLTVCETAVQIASDIIMPSMSICMALGIINAVNPIFNLTSLTDFIKKSVKFILGFVMTIFIGLLSIQSIVGVSADTIGVKAAKYLAANCIPVVGGAIADAYTTLKASLGLLRGGVGFFGIAVIFLTVVPPLTELIIMCAAFSLAELAGDIFGTKQIGVLIKNSLSVLSIMFSILAFFSVMLIISTTIVMMTGLNIS